MEAVSAGRPQRREGGSMRSTTCGSRRPEVNAYRIGHVSLLSNYAVNTTHAGSAIRANKHILGKKAKKAMT